MPVRHLKPACGSACLSCSWSAISRRERYLKRCTEAGDEVPLDADQNLLPGMLNCNNFETALRGAGLLGQPAAQ